MPQGSSLGREGSAVDHRLVRQSADDGLRALMSSQTSNTEGPSVLRPEAHREAGFGFLVACLIMTQERLKLARGRGCGLCFECICEGEQGKGSPPERSQGAGHLVGTSKRHQRWDRASGVGGWWLMMCLSPGPPSHD